jgi:hypothetical protein
VSSGYLRRIVDEDIKHEASVVVCVSAFGWL